MKGWLAKWTNYLKGYQKRWFVLSNGLLSYYRNQAEMAHTCRGTISLVSAVIHTEDSCNFVISNGGTQTFHLKASNEIERQKWVTALELAKARAVRMMESEEDEELDMPSQLDKCELLTVLRLLHVKLEDLSMCSELIGKHGAALQRSLSDLEQLDAAAAGGGPELAARVRAVNERATLFRITSTAMMNLCGSGLVKMTEYRGSLEMASQGIEGMLLFLTPNKRSWCALTQGAGNGLTGEAKQ
ncbi:oxysterol-binding protein 1 [Rhipicephalus sanguineus]|uniref:oxysterol-binding protein 1 n=1 Tax=Rhipicephalus sanguineus TaxID=34632 RepID=UPI0020C4E616|nr:oxysterol-binding protein 1 [Rhipicephalus sanguineus]